MERLINRLSEIQKEHAEFFRKSEKDITEYITQGQFSSEFFINSDLPIEVIAKIRLVFDSVVSLKGMAVDANTTYY